MPSACLLGFDADEPDSARSAKFKRKLSSVGCSATPSAIRLLCEAQKVAGVNDTCKKTKAGLRMHRKLCKVMQPVLPGDTMCITVV